MSGKAESLYWYCTSLNIDSKSQIAIQYCYKYKSEQPGSHVFWVHCGSVARFDQGYKEIARKLKLPGLHDPAIDVVKSVYDWLSDDDNGSWLLVLDNADDQEMFFKSSARLTSHDALQQQLGPLAQFLPRSIHGSTLITTRDRRVGERFAERDKPINVLPLEAEDAKSMLLSRLPDQDGTTAEVMELLESLQYLPLAITQAASYISEEAVTVSRYLELLRPGNADSKALLEQDYYDSRRHPDIQNSVFQTWKLSFIQIRQQMPRAAEMLSLMCVLDKQSISRKLLRHEGESQVIFDRAVATLKNFSLIQEERSQQTYEIHRLVQLSTQWWLEQEQALTKSQERALDILLRECPSNSVEDWKAWESLSPHIAMVQGCHFQHDEHKLKCADITLRTGGYNFELGRYEVALKMDVAALAAQQELLGKEHPDTLVTMNNLAVVLRRRGKYEEAEEMHRQALGPQETVLGKENPDTLTSMNNLALVLGDQGKYEEAEEMHRQALGLQETVLGKEHPDTLTSMNNNLVTVLRDQGKYKEAEEMNRQVLGLRETVLGREHPDTLATMNNLASVLRDQGKYEEAEEMNRQVLRLMETVLGKEHPSTLTSMNNLAIVLRDQGKYEEVEGPHRQALQLQETVLGKEHPHVVMSMNNLAMVLGDQGKYKEAEEMHRQVLRLSETVLGKEHPSTLMSMNNLALVLGDQGKYEEAEEMHRQVLRLKETVLGKEHPETLTSMNNLAWVMSQQGKYDQAEETHRQVLRLSETVLGKEHPFTLTSMNNLALVLGGQGKYEQAEEMHRQALRLKETVLGKEHPDTLTSMHNLAYVLSDRKRFSEADALYQRALNGYGKTLASDHPTVQACRRLYTSMLKEIEEDIEGKDILFKDCVETAELEAEHS